jgi:LysR family hydrogen peroxide-inducible transcriptional activator
MNATSPSRLGLRQLQYFVAVTDHGSIGLFGDTLTIGVLPSVRAYFIPIANRRLHSL